MVTFAIVLKAMWGIFPKLKKIVLILKYIPFSASKIYEPHREKTRFLPRRKQRRRSASR